MRSSPNNFTALLPDGVVDVSGLLEFDPARRLQAFRSTLNRRGAAEASGFLFACIHGEFDPTTCLFHLHLHGLASDGYLDLLDSLRSLPAYRSARGSGEKQKVRIGRRPLDNLPYPLTYIVQSSWPSRWRGEIDGVAQRSAIRARIPEPYHTAHLLWLDRWSLQDVTLLMGLRVTPDGMALTDRPHRTRKGSDHMK